MSCHRFSNGAGMGADFLKPGCRANFIRANHQGKLAAGRGQCVTRGTLPKYRSFRLGQFGQQFVVGFVLLQCSDERLHRFDGIQIDHHAAELAH